MAIAKHNLAQSGAPAIRAAVMALTSAAFLTVCGSDAFAFDQTAPGQAVTPQIEKLQGIEIAPSTSTHSAGVELTLPSVSLGGNSADRSVGLAIPGLGNLPKLDFGLELLYGTPEQASPNPDLSDALPNALTVHGAVKKTF